MSNQPRQVVVITGAWTAKCPACGWERSGIDRDSVGAAANAHDCPASSDED